MCGIAGIHDEAVRQRDIDLMLAMISHRGPDEFGTYVDDQIGLGTARLAIIDIQHGQQPMRHDETGVVIVFNGEVFNYLELREELLEFPDALRTDSDTEVILHLYLQYGKAFTTHLNGQFAICIWDPRNQTMILARDRFGICPLFYHSSKRLFAFASEIKALLTIPRIPKQINSRAIDQIFSFWVPVAGTTAFSEVREVPPGHLLTYHNDTLRLEPYWQWDFPELQDRTPMDFKEAQEALRGELSRSISLRLRADIEVGSYLSGGIDSSALVALGTKLQPSGLKTFSIAFGDETYDERKYQEIVSQHCGTKHRCFDCGYEDIDRGFERAVWHAEAPLFRTAPCPLNLLSRSVNDAGIKVVLSGEGADEILLGYDLFREVKLRRFWQRQPDSEIRPQLFKRLYAYLPQFTNPRFANLAIQSFKSNLMSDSPFYSHLLRWSNNAANKVYFGDRLRDDLSGYDCLEDLRATLPADFFKVGDIDRAQYLEIATLLRGYLLASQGDRMTMANSVEGRYPYLDHHFVGFANALPKKYKMPHLRDKLVLREAFRSLLPREICYRPKFAYQAPEIRAFFDVDGSRSDLVEQHMSDSAIRETEYFKPSLVRGLLKKIAASKLSRLGTRDNMAVVQILSTQILNSNFVRADLRAIAQGRVPHLSFTTRLKNGVRTCNTIKS